MLDQGDEALFRLLGSRDRDVFVPGDRITLHHGVLLDDGFGLAGTFARKVAERVNRFAVAIETEMQMGTGTSAGAPDPADGLPPFDLLAQRNTSFRPRESGSTYPSRVCEMP